jgi:tetratricopeptide (TPR) repeat protein
MPELHQYYKELIATDLTTTIFLASYACDESKIDAIAKINCAIYLGNVQHNNDIFYKNQYEALEILDLVPERHRGPEYFSVIGGQLININKLDDAKTALKASISLCETAGALASLASVHNRLDDNEKALTLADRALTISPNHFSARAIKGIVLCCLGRHAEAIPLLAQAVREQPLYPPTMESLGKSLIASGEVMVNFASLLRTGNFDHENRALELIELLAELLVD